jgi:heme-degrading monooxygenase HmoA
MIPVQQRSNAMIARIWKGVTRSQDADTYLDYLRRTGLAAYRATPGNRAAFALRRVVDGRAEFLLLTLWESREAIASFAGPDPDRAVFYPEDDRFLVDRDLHVDHFDLVFSAGDVPGGS